MGFLLWWIDNYSHYSTFILMLDTLVASAVQSSKSAAIIESSYSACVASIVTLSDHIVANKINKALCTSELFLSRFLLGAPQEHWAVPAERFGARFLGPIFSRS